MIISIDAEKIFYKIQYLSLIKTLNKIGTDKNLFYIVKRLCLYPKANILLIGEH